MNAPEILDPFAKDLYYTLPHTADRSFFDWLLQKSHSENPLDRARVYEEHLGSILNRRGKKVSGLQHQIASLSAAWKHITESNAHEQSVLARLKAELRLTMDNAEAAERIIARQHARIKKLIAENKKQILAIEKRVEAAQTKLRHTLAHAAHFTKQMDGHQKKIKAHLGALEAANQPDRRANARTASTIMEKIKRVTEQMDLEALQFLKNTSA